MSFRRDRSRNSFTLDTRNVDVALPNDRIKTGKALKGGSKEIVKSGRKLTSTKIKIPKGKLPDVSFGKLPTADINPDVIQMGSRFFTSRRRG